MSRRHGHDRDRVGGHAALWNTIFTDDLTVVMVMVVVMGVGWSP
jgi:flagellar motor protein MotB